MGIFDFLKKTETAEATEITKAQNEREESKNNACVGVLDFLPMKETNNLKKEFCSQSYLVVLVHSMNNSCLPFASDK